MLGQWRSISHLDHRRGRRYRRRRSRATRGTKTTRHGREMAARFISPPTKAKAGIYGSTCGRRHDRARDAERQRCFWEPSQLTARRVVSADGWRVAIAGGITERGCTATAREVRQARHLSVGAHGVLFPEGVAFDGNRFDRTAATARLFKCLTPVERAEERLVSLTNVRELEPVRRLAEQAGRDSTKPVCHRLHRAPGRGRRRPCYRR